MRRDFNLNNFRTWKAKVGGAGSGGGEGSGGRGEYEMNRQKKRLQLHCHQYTSCGESDKETMGLEETFRRLL